MLSAPRDEPKGARHMKPETKEKPRRVSNRMLAIIFASCSLLALFVSVYKEFRIVEPVKGVLLPLQSDTIIVYVPSGEQKLAEKKMDVKMGVPERQKADIIMSELRRSKAMPEEVKLYDFSTDDEGTLYLNLSKEIRDTALTSMREIVMTYAIINSFLATFKNMKQVQLLADGQPFYTLNGVMYTYMPLEFNRDLLEE
jgi:hypothetical protein